MTIEILHEKFDQVHKKIKNRIKKTTTLNDIDLDSEYYEFHEQTSLSDFLLPELSVSQINELELNLKLYNILNKFQETDISASMISIFATKKDNEILADLNLETLDILNW